MVHARFWIKTLHHTNFVVFVSYSFLPWIVAARGLQRASSACESKCSRTSCHNVWYERDAPEGPSCAPGGHPPCCKAGRKCCPGNALFEWRGQGRHRLGHLRKCRCNATMCGHDVPSCFFWSPNETAVPDFSRPWEELSIDFLVHNSMNFGFVCVNIQFFAAILVLVVLKRGQLVHQSIYTCCCASLIGASMWRTTCSNAINCRSPRSFMSQVDANVSRSYSGGVVKHIENGNWEMQRQ